MRSASLVLTVLLITPAFALSQADATQNSKPSKHLTITGCLTGKPDAYRLKDAKGKTVIPYSKTVDLEPYVGKSVTVVGDLSAAPSTDTGTGRPLPHFQVREAQPGSSTCK
jgi:hypothetical protein